MNIIEIISYGTKYDLIQFIIFHAEFIFQIFQHHYFKLH